MIVYEDGTVFGTIGGGCAEAGLVQTAREVIRSGSYQFCKVDMTGEVAAEEGGVRRMDDDGSASSTCRIRNERFHRNNSSANKMDSTFSILTQTAPHHAYQVPLCVRTGPSISSNIVATDGSAGSILFPS